MQFQMRIKSDFPTRASSRLSKMSKIQFKFDPNQEHQKRAIESALELLEGFPKNIRQISAFSDECIPNIPPDSTFDWDLLAENLKKVQEKNDIQPALVMNYDEGFELPVQDKMRITKYPSFTLEMETGTGKTYTYLRTIFELRKQFGFGKFIIVVPSVAIYEGVIKAVEMTGSHFRSLYHNENLHFIDYDGNRLGQLRDFSHSQFLTVMVMTIAAFNKLKNNIFKPTEKLMGEKLPYQYIQETRPIFILDECQNYETETAKQAIRTLSPLFALKYSATAGSKDSDGIWQYDNLVYRLDPLEAFRRNLVKRIQVFGATEIGNANSTAPIHIKAFHRGPEATLELLVDKSGRRDFAEVRVKKNSDLEAKTKNPDYAGLIVRDIRLHDKVIEFDSLTLQAKTDEQAAKEKKELFKRQIEETVLRHMEHQQKLLPQNIKVLSLFFIDRVENYRGNEGLIRKLFETAFEKYKGAYPHFKRKDAEKVHEGYFAQKPTGEEINTDSRNQQEEDAEKRAYELIMRKKEVLLSFEEDVSFIFAHSALKEGWDNPNVFQICTLAQRYSERRKRQEIGRGMRLCVDQNGDRVHDAATNTLTVIANESYDSFVKALQAEYRETGNALPPAPTNAKRSPAKRNDAVFKRKEFAAFWDKLAQSTNYTIKFDTEKVINEVVGRFSKEIVAAPEILVKKGLFAFAKYEVKLVEIKGDKAKIKTSLTSSTGTDNDREFSATYAEGALLDKHDKNLRDFKIVEIRKDAVVFGNEVELLIGETKDFSVELPLVYDTSGAKEKGLTFPVFDIVGRTARETLLTRKTIIEILRRISDERKEDIFQNPEGFTSRLIFSIKETLANHVADNIEYQISKEIESPDFKKLFPAEAPHPQRELEKGSEASLYDYVQYESSVEQSFIRNRLNNDKKVVCYFKFPDSFRIKLPQIIGNYVPDWGVIRESDEGQRMLELVRETKATVNRNLLQYPNERRKIACAEKHFARVGIDYRDITADIADWYLPAKAPETKVIDTRSIFEILTDIPDVDKFNTYLPVYSLAAVATGFTTERINEPLGWKKMDVGYKLNDKFIAKVTGKSMEPTIPDGSYCVFRHEKGGSRGNMGPVLVESRTLSDEETLQSFTIKRYKSEKQEMPDGTWRHKRIILSPANKDFRPIVLENVAEGDFHVVAEFVEVITS